MHNNLTYDSTATAATSSTIPAWLDDLLTASIRTDMIAADVNGTVTYSGLEKLFAHLAANLSTSKSSLTAAEMTDLKTIAANLNNGMSTSAYLVSITNALVNGNAANATWTGGAASATKLGNLAVGSSGTQLSELVGKWFLGTDLPSSTVVLDSASGRRRHRKLRRSGKFLVNDRQWRLARLRARGNHGCIRDHLVLRPR
jgi:hypothetical protein